MLQLRRALPILLSLLYVASPVDLVPDFLPGLGWVDDLLVIGALLWYLSHQRGRPSPWDAFWRTPRPEAGPRTTARDAPPDFSESDPYALLEIPRTATAEEIHAAYRRAIARYHPDKVAHLGHEFQALAHQKLLAIQRAYETLRR